MSVFNCYRNKRVLITGNSGFKGSWLTLWLLKVGAQVGGLSVDIPTTPSLYETLGLEKSIKQYWLDIRNLAKVKAAFSDFQPDYVFHLAAQPIVSQSYKDPVETFSTNVMGMLNVLQAIKLTETIKSAVLITSDKCYENLEWPYGYREIDRLGGKDPYSASKACAELVSHAYYYSFFSKNGELGVATTRAGNVIGGGDWAPDRLIPDLVRSWSNDETLNIRSPGATRPWQHVLEPLSGYLSLGERLYKHPEKFSGRAYNFGPLEGSMKSVATVIKAMHQYWPESKWTVTEKDMKESSLLKLDCSAAQHDLSWSGILDFSQTIAFTSEWYKMLFESSERALDFSLEQIESYSVIAKEMGMAWAL